MRPHRMRRANGRLNDETDVDGRRGRIAQITTCSGATGPHPVRRNDHAERQAVSFATNTRARWIAAPMLLQKKLSI
jgi:hypothetical protein